MVIISARENCKISDMGRGKKIENWLLQELTTAAVAFNWYSWLIIYWGKHNEKIVMQWQTERGIKCNNNQQYAAYEMQLSI